MTRRLRVLRASAAMICAAVWVTPLAAQSPDPAGTFLRIAFSPRLGIEVLAASAAWCGVMPALRVVAERRATFDDDAALAALLQRLGAAVIAHDCPAAQAVAFVGSTRQEPAAVVWRGRAAAADGWAVTQEALAVAKPPPIPAPMPMPLPVPVPAPVVAAPPPAAHPPAAGQRDRLAALAEAAMAQVRAAQPLPSAMPGVPPMLAPILAPIAKAAELAPSLAADPLGAEFAARLRETGLDVARSRATAQLPHYLADLADLPPTHAAALQLALAAVLIARSDSAAPGVLAPLLVPTLRAARAAGDGACAAAAAASGISTIDAARPMLVGPGVATYATLLCRLQAAGIALVSDERATLFSKERDELLRLMLPASMPAVLVAQVTGPTAFLPLKGVTPTPPPADPFDFAPLKAAVPAAPGGAGAAFKLWLRTVELQPGVSALVGVKLGDDANPTPLSVAQWQQWTDNLTLVSGGFAFDAQDCAHDRAALTEFQAAQALLACPLPAESR